MIALHQFSALQPSQSAATDVLPPSAPVMCLLSGFPELALPPLPALSARVLGLHLSDEGRLGDKHQSFSTLHVGLVWLFVAGRLHVWLEQSRMWGKDESALNAEITLVFMTYCAVSRPTHTCWCQRVKTTTTAAHLSEVCEQAHENGD